METRMKPKLRIFNNLEDLSHHAARIFVEQAAQSIGARGRFLVALNGGSTPNRLFQLLASDHREKIDWSKTHVFWGDERCVPPDDPGSSYGQAYTAFLSQVPILDSNIHRVKAELTPAEASIDYVNTLRGFTSPPLDVPRFDLVYLGMGEDGHTASLFPGSPVDVTESVIAVTAQYQDRPANRVTMTQRVFNQACMIVFMATGAKKAVTLAEVLSGRYNPELYPAQRIEPKEGKLIWLVDEEAAGRLPNHLTAKFCEG
ncbi:MAG: 6-phosphogluconolactonase [Anaerolineales bacterium]|nr:MAG: 6-phosphogluconolactonase [Anaerolineales bacterium]